MKPPFTGELISFLRNWQTFIGAFIGGILGLLAALIVARDARRREERAAAMLLVTDLHSIRVAAETLNGIINAKEVSGEEKARLIANMLSEERGELSLSPLFESSMVRMMPLDNYLAAHLALFKKIFVLVLARLTELKRIVEMSKLPGRVMITREELDSQAQIINKHFNFAVEHATCAEHLLNKLILRWTAPFHRIARRVPVIKRLELRGEKTCIDLLEKGSSFLKEKR